MKENFDVEKIGLLLKLTYSRRFFFFVSAESDTARRDRISPLVITAFASSERVRFAGSPSVVQIRFGDL